MRKEPCGHADARYRQAAHRDYDRTRDWPVEIGFVLLGEMQEEILWLGEVAQVPVISATQVL